jgi:hypothetical protein
MRFLDPRPSAASRATGISHYLRTPIPTDAPACDRFRPQWLSEWLSNQSPKGKNPLRPEGFEPPTLGSEVRCSVQLSYGRPPGNYLR